LLEELAQEPKQILLSRACGGGLREVRGSRSVQ
jgi:hypothetical protein